MQDKHILVFIEVRYRQNLNFGNTVETVHLAKQIKLIKTAKYYLQHFPQLERLPCRFDVFAVDRLAKPQRWFEKLNTSQRCSAQVEWVKNAFSE
jgi:putative endonuclease